MFKGRKFKVLAGGAIAVLALAIVSPASAGTWSDTVSYNGCTGANLYLTATSSYSLAYTHDAGSCTTGEQVQACARTQGGVPACTGYITEYDGLVQAQQSLANNYAGTSNHRIEVGSGNWSGYWNSAFTLV